MRPRMQLVAVVVAVVTSAVAAAGVATAETGSEAVASGVVDADTGTFHALTYNVAGLPEGLSGSNPSVNTPLISPLLNDYDLVVVQEDWADPEPPIPGVDFFHDDLISQVTHPYLSTPATAPQGQDPRRPSALVADGLNRLSRFPFGPVTRVMWPNCFGGADTSDGGAGDCLSQKGFSIARTEFAPGIEIDVYNLHAEAGGTALDEQYSAEDFETLAAYIVANSAGRAVLVGGDYNLHTDRALDGEIFDSFLAATGLVDVCAVVECGADADQIDKWVFRSGGGVTLDALDHEFERETFVRSDGEPLSDHDALAVTFGWTRQAPGSVTGVVTDSSGAGVPGVTVAAFGPLDTWVATASATTDGSGAYTLAGVVPGDYRLLFIPPVGFGLVPVWFDAATTRGVATPVTVPIGAAATADAAFAIGGSISGSVTDTHSAPVAGAHVWAYRPGDLWVGSGLAVTAADGSYHLEGLEPGEYRVFFRPLSTPGLRAEWFDDSAKRSSALALSVVAGAPVEAVDAQLESVP